jgi:hypothetical protein
MGIFVIRRTKAINTTAPKADAAADMSPSRQEGVPNGKAKNQAPKRL